jgi:glutaredoxin
MKILRAFAIVAFALLCLAGCKRPPAVDDLAPEPTASAKPLPPLVINDETPDLLLTWIDAKGDAHTAEKPANVPMEGRDQVRVVVTTRDEGTQGSFYVANLTNQNADKSYPVSTMSRSDWDTIIAKRRQAARPPEQAAADPQAAADAGPAGPFTVIVYGASWCGACHQVMDFLKQRRVPAVEKDIEADPGANEEMRAKLARAGLRGASSIPVVDVGGRILVGFDPRAMEDALRTRGAVAL